MQTAKVFENGRSQAVRLPREFRFSENEVYIQKLGDAVILYPKNRVLDIFLEGINGFSDDFMDEGRLQDIDAPRDEL